MPKVGKKEFDYTEKGKAEAKAYAKETGQEVKYPTYDAGGRVKTYRVGGEVKPRIHDADDDSPLYRRDWGRPNPKTVRGRGATRLGARPVDKLMDDYHKARVGTKKQAKIAKEIKESLKKGK